jgi:peptidoglycan/xylan/chitin deacetylase (PgdA/CDA1 family)
MKDALRKLVAAAHSPGRAAARLLAALGVGRRDHRDAAEEAFRRYGRLARRQGFRRLYVLFSCDCDTPEDAAAAAHLDMWLRERAVPMSYAVPGAQLEADAEVYRRIAAAGAEFISHGARAHTERYAGGYRSTTFYDTLSLAEVVDDIERGHQICASVLGEAPSGFRTPHFGAVQQTERQALVYDTLRRLGCRYSSSALPQVGLRYGPLLCLNGLFEVPLSGSYLHPYTVLDSWNYVESPERLVLRSEYATLLMQTVDRLLALGVPGVLNYYVDPLHVYRSDAFYRAVQYVLERGVPMIRFRDLWEITAATTAGKDD